MKAFAHSEYEHRQATGVPSTKPEARKARTTFKYIAATATQTPTSIKSIYERLIGDKGSVTVFTKPWISIWKGQREQTISAKVDFGSATEAMDFANLTLGMDSPLAGLKVWRLSLRRNRRRPQPAADDHWHPPSDCAAAQLLPRTPMQSTWWCAPPPIIAGRAHAGLSLHSRV